MRARLTTALALVLVAQWAWAGHGSSSSHGSSGHGSSGHSSSSHTSSSKGSSGGSHTWSSKSGWKGGSGGGFWSGITGAEGRHPRPGTGSRYRHGFYGGYPYYGSQYWYGSYYPYDSFYWGAGYYPYAYYSSPYYYGYGYRHFYRNGDAGSIRLLVDPDQARVYVDGYYAGIVDDFDGLFQRLHVSAGRHEITLKLEGYKTHRIRLLVPYDRTLKIHYDMVKGGGEDEIDDLVGSASGYDPDRPRRGDRYDADDDRDRDRDRDTDADRESDTDRDRDADRPSVRSRDDDQAGAREREGRGELRLSVRPDDASVYVDGQFRGSGRQVGTLELPPGRHRVEVVRPGFRTFEHEVDVEGGHPTDLDVELKRP